MMYFAEINKTDNEHEVINRCLLQMITAIYAKDTVVFWGAERHFNSLKLDRNETGENKFVNVLTPKDGNKIFWIWKYMNEAFWITRVLYAATKHKINLVFFSSLSVPGLYFIHHLSGFFFKKVPVLITLHGELGLLTGGQKLNTAELFFSRMLRKALKGEEKNIAYLVLGRTIKNEVIRRGLLPDKKILCIEHPYRFPKESRLREPYIRPAFGHLGIAKRSKNSDLFFKLAADFKKEIEAGKIAFKLVGRLWNDFSNREEVQFVEYADTEVFLERELYRQRMEEVDYAVFFYDDKQYALTGSGAVMDAIAHNLPMLCLRNEYFNDLFSIPGKAEPGWLFDDFEALARKIQDIMAGKELANYARQVSAIQELKKHYSLDNIQAKLNAELREHNFLKSAGREND